MSDRVIASQSASAADNLSAQIGMATLSRLVINTVRRFVYPFAPALSRGLGVPLTAITALIAVNQVTGILSPLFGPLGDRWGYRVMLLAAVSMLVVGMVAAGLLPFYGVIMVGLFLAGLAKSIFDPALQAYVGERVPYERRGLIIGVIELSWSGSSLLGIPAMGLLIDRLGWRTPFLVLGGLGLLALVGLALLIPGRRPQPVPAGRATGIRDGWQQLRRERTALAGLGFAFLTGMANDNLFVVYGAWLESAFALSIVALGAATTVIGVAEMMGEILTASLSDRLGLKQAVVIGLILSILSYALLPVIGYTLPLALAGLFLTFLTFEFGVVAAISFSTEVLPGARATMMSAFLAVMSLGRMSGALLGGPVWLAGGFTATGLVSAALSALALVLIGWGWRSRRIARDN